MLLVEGQRGAVGHDLEPQLVLVAGRDLAHHHRAAHPGDGAEQDQGHVLGGDRPPGPGASAPPAAAKAGTWAPACSRSGTAVTSSAHTEARRSPVTNSTRSHQCEPMSAKARDGPDSSASTRQLSSWSVDSQSCR